VNKQKSQRERRRDATQIFSDRDSNGRPRPGTVSHLDLVKAGFDPVTEPYMQLELARVAKDMLHGLRLGKVKLPDSYNLRALPDLTGTLRADEVCVVVDGSELPRPISLLDGEPFDILVYGAPGMHPGDIRKLRVASTDALRRMIGSADPSRCNAIFFSIQGERSEQDCIAGGDFDGDKRNAICWQPLVQLVSDNYPPYNPAQASVTYARHLRPTSGANAPTAPLRTPPVDATKLEERLVANYLMARFNSSALVCRCGILWQQLAEKHGANHPLCLMADHLYRVGLDAMPPDTAAIHTKYLPRAVRRCLPSVCGGEDAEKALSTHRHRRWQFECIDPPGCAHHSVAQEQAVQRTPRSISRAQSHIHHPA